MALAVAPLTRHTAGAVARIEERRTKFEPGRGAARARKRVRHAEAAMGGFLCFLFAEGFWGLLAVNLVASVAFSSIIPLGETVVLAVKLQELFGLTRLPAIAGGKRTISAHLLTPAGRPAAITDNLERFWRENYPAVRKDLRGRYPKHPWPEDPLAADATALTKRRLSGSGGQ